MKPTRSRKRGGWRERRSRSGSTPTRGSGRRISVPPGETAWVASRTLDQRESFVFETVFSDPAGDKLAFLKRAEAQGHAVVLCFIGLAGPEVSEERVAMRVLQGGHDVPSRKLRERYPRSLKNLAQAIRELPHVVVHDNSDLARPFRKVAVFERGSMTEKHAPLPRWLPRGR